MEQIALKVRSGATPTGGEAAYLPRRSRWALIRSQNVFDHHFDSSGMAFITDEQASALQGATVEEGDILLNLTGDGVTFARACAVPSAALPACVNQHVAIIRVDPDLAVAGFVLAYLTHPSVKRYIEGFNAGGSRRAITKAHISSFLVPLPPLREQRAIARILGALDDKIELNRRMNETLEAMARAIFKSWFVDFDPVRAKAEGRDMGLPADLAALFPDGFEDSELGEIPRGWRVTSLAQYALLNNESWAKETRPDVIQYVDLGNTKWGRVEEIVEYTKADAPSRAQRVLRAGDTIVGTVRPGNGSYALVPEDGWTGSTGFAVLRPKREEYLELVYLTATTKENIEMLAHLADGAAYPAVRPDVVLATSLVTTESDHLIRRFSEIVSPLLRRMAASNNESRTLAALRDTLLPKLLSGEVRVPEPEGLVAEVAGYGTK